MGFLHPSPGSNKKHIQNQKGIPIKTNLNGSDKKHSLNLKGLLTQTSLNGLQGSDKKHSQNHKGILTQTNLYGLLGSDQPGSQNGEALHFSAAKPSGLDAKTMYNVQQYNAVNYCAMQCRLLQRVASYHCMGS